MAKNSDSAFFDNVRVCSLPPPIEGQAQDYGLIDDAAIAVREGKIAWVGPRRECPAQWHNCGEHIDLQGALLTPGLIDCHTHMVYGGDRAREFEQRLQGVSYADIARAGGGILSSVRATRAASADDLQLGAARRLQDLLAEGLTCVEIKSGYGLDDTAEEKMLRAARALENSLAVDVRTTFLGAHALPPEYAGRADDYIAHLCEHSLPQIKAQDLADAVDVFCEIIGFTLAQSQKLLSRARELGFAVKIHAEQLSDQKGARMAATLGALSVDHIEYLDEADVPVLAQHGCVAVLLPGAFYYLREAKLPPFAALRQHRVPMALATDHNPGTSPCHSLLLMMNMACTLFRFTPLEALQGVTCHAAQALGLQQRKGRIAAGMDADFALFDVAHPAELSYRFGHNPNVGRVYSGRYFPRP